MKYHPESDTYQLDDDDRTIENLQLHTSQLEEKCKAIYETIIALLDENIKYFERKEQYRGQDFENPWSEERIKEYNKTRIQGFKYRKDFITKFYKGE